MENDITRQRRAEIDRHILHYVRGMQSMAPVTSESIFGYLTGAARLRVEVGEVRDRLLYLVKARHLEQVVEWDGGEVTRFEITAEGMDVLDGNIPPRNWRGAGHN